VHAYNYDSEHSTFIVECTEETCKKAGLISASEDDTVAYCEALFAEELEGHGLIKNRSLWRSFPDVSNENWFHNNLVLVGDAAHTAHFSVGSGTKLAMEDIIALVSAMEEHDDMKVALQAYEDGRRPEVESLQRAARVSEAWFVETERYFNHMEPLQFAFSLLTRSLRITHENLRLRDPDFVAAVDQWFCGGSEATPPMLTPFELRGLQLENRIMVSPMCQYSAQDGVPNDWHMVHLGSRAVGGAGLLMTEMTDVSADARISLGCTGLYTDEQRLAWQRIVSFVHKNSHAKIGMQLAHAGPKGATKLAWEGMDEPLEEGAWPIISASPLPYFEHSQIPREMSRQDMERVRDDFVRATGLAEEADFDLVELHCAHGYLLASFLSPLTNHRSDDYGGSLENRMRYPLEVFSAMRAVWPKHKPMSVRISATDWVAGAFVPEDAVVFAKALKSAGCDIVDVSAGQTVAGTKPAYGRLFQTPFSEQVRMEAQIPTITVGNISSYADVNSILAAGRADLCALARAHLYDPYWTRHAAFEQFVDMPYPNPYSSIDHYVPRAEWTLRGSLGLKKP
jgi:anthraniloyl-CoA monooxygenase